MYRFSFLLFFSISTVSFAQIPKDIVTKYRKIIHLIQQNKVNELSLLIEYPIKRDNPVPDISNAKSFIAYYPTLFDQAFKNKLAKFRSIDILERNGVYGLAGKDFAGDIWINSKGKIIAVNYRSEKEILLKQKLIKKVKAKIHPSINTWEENILVWKSGNLLLRVDETEKGLRYAAWSHGQAISDKPDIILYNGTEESMPHNRGWTYTFTDKALTYSLQNIRICNNTADCGRFLKVYNKKKLKQIFRLTETK